MQEAPDAAPVEVGPAAEIDVPQSRRLIAAPALVLALALALTFIAYCSTLGFRFVYDDHPQIENNRLVSSWRYAPRYFTEHVWESIVPGVPGNYYRPVFLLWLRVNHMLFGLNPWGYHLSSVLLHILVTILVYFLALRITGEPLTSALAALIFGVHPVHIEAVAWVSGATDPLLAAFLISSFLCYLKSREKPRCAGWWQVASIAFYVLSVLAKESAIILPIFIFAYEYLWGRPTGEEGASAGRLSKVRRAARRVFPHLSLVPVYLGIRDVVLKGLSHTAAPLPLSTIVFTWPALLWFYLRRLLWPVGLSPCYDSLYVTKPDFFNFLLPLVAVVGSGLVLWAWARQVNARRDCAPGVPRSGFIGFSVAWVLVPFLPMIDLSVLPKGDFVHDRYLYLPSAGWAILAGVALRSIQFGRVKLGGQRVFQVAMASLVALLYVVGTVLQSAYWADDLSLFYRGMITAPNNGTVRANMGTVMAERGLYNAAIELFNQALTREPGLWEAQYNLGVAYYQLGKFSEAETCLRRAIAINVNRPDEFLYLGLTLLKMGRLEDGVTALRRAIKMSPNGNGLHFALGVALKLQGDLDGALSEFKAELALDPFNKEAVEQIKEIEQR